jgi:ABC-type Fe3+-hydroxamate transport system substrate-binding protein
MTIRSIKVAACFSTFAAMLAVGMALPVQQASAQVQAVPREGVSFNDTVTAQVTVETVDTDSRTVAVTLPSGRTVLMPVANSVTNLGAIDDGSLATITYTEVVTLLNLRQKGPGSQEARRDQMSGKPDANDIATGRFTLTVVAVDLDKNTVSVINGNGGAVRTYSANSIAKQDMLKKIKVGDVVIGMTTPLMITSISK